MALAALVLSVVSACTAIVAIGVSIWTHKQQGSNVTCQVRRAMLLSHGHAAEDHLAVNAVNDGRAPTSIQGWGFVFLDIRGKPTGLQVVPQSSPRQPILPHRLESESSASWMTPIGSIRDAVADHKPFYGLKAFVRTGADRMIYSDEPVIKFD